MNQIIKTNKMKSMRQGDVRVLMNTLNSGVGHVIFIDVIVSLRVCLCVSLYAIYLKKISAGRSKSK